jgi:Protein of unknown function (DUF1826)
MTLTKKHSWALTLWLFLVQCCDDCILTGSAAAFSVTTPSTTTVLNRLRKRRKREIDWLLATTDLGAFADTKEVTASPSLVESLQSVMVFHLPCPKSHAWRPLVPPLKLFDGEGGRGDVTVEWRVGDSINDVAEKMLGQLGLECKQDSAVLVDHLTRCMEQFQSFCLKHLLFDTDDSIAGFRARIVAARGSLAPKCPRWHVDHVPVRWIQSLVGPGCVCLEQDPVTSVHNQSSWSTNDWQKYLDDMNDNVSPASRGHFQARQVAEQEVALLVGNRFNEFALNPRPYVPPAIHKSPTLRPWQGRVLLKMDVIVPHCITIEASG